MFCFPATVVLWSYFNFAVRLIGRAIRTGVAVRGECIRTNGGWVGGLTVPFMYSD